MEEKRRQEEAAMEAERQKLLLEREQKMKLEFEKREREQQQRQQRLMLDKERERLAEKDSQQREREQFVRDLDVRSSQSEHSRQDSLEDGSTLSDHSGPTKTPSIPSKPTSPAKASMVTSVSHFSDASSNKAMAAMKVLLQSRDEEVERLKKKVSSLEADLENALSLLSSLSVSKQNNAASSTPSQNIASMSQQHMASHAYMLQQMSMNPSESILGQSSASVPYSRLYGNRSVNPQASPGRQQSGVGVGSAGNSSVVNGSVGSSSVGNASVVNGSVGVNTVGQGQSDVDANGVQQPAGLDDFAHLGLITDLLE